MRHITRAAALALVLTVIPSVLHAQTLGEIAGSVKDASGAILPGVTVEAASPVLIEKTRSAVTDGTGRYRIVNLPPGTYAVTFTLQGFNTVRREAVQVAASFTATIDAELKVGSLQETITVTGESPVVDLQSAAQTKAMTAETFKEIPSSGSWIQMAALVPAVRAQVQDVGGILGDQTGAQVSAHGSLNGDGVSLIDGLRIGNMYLASNLTNMSLSPLLFDQVDVQLSGQTGETGTNGVIMNAIPKSGGNTFSGSFLANGSAPSLQSSNITDRLQARGLSGASTTLKKLYDINGAIGGPIVKDKLWFYATSRYFTNNFYLASRFYPTDVTAFRNTPDTSNQAYGGTYTYDNNARLTWAMNEKMKLTGWYAYQYKVDPFWLIQTFIQAPEASRITTWHTQLSTTKWTYTATNHLLFEAGVAAGASPDTIKVDLTRVGGVAINELGGAIAPPLTYRAPTGFDFNDKLPSQSYNAAMSYVTGSHNAKFGVDLQQGHFWRGDNNDSTGGMWYTTRDYVPIQVTIQAPVSGWQSNLNYNMGLFAQDRWTTKRLTLSGGVRLDLQNESAAAFTAGPTKWAPNRSQAFAEVPNVPNWKDIDPRVSVAYDLFGNGKTALKASASRGVQQDSIGIAQANNPATTIVTSTARNWTDANHDLTPNCDLLNPVANGECGPWLSPTFGTAVPGTVYDPKIMNGWGVRPYNWEFSTSVQQEILPRLSATIGYYRRIYGNFWVTDNTALAASDFTQYSIAVPTDPRLSNSGATLGGFYDANRIVAPKNVVTAASNYGTQLSHWNGFDVSVDARLQNGVLLSGGVSTGKTMTDNCAIVTQVPEILTAVGVTQSAAYCHQESPFLPQYKALASYTFPYGIRVAGTLQSLPGPNVLANNVYVGTTGTLGRPFTNGTATLGLIAPNSVWGDRLNEFDLRFTKVVNTGGRSRLDLNVDLFNAFNSDAILGQNNTFGAAWQRPLTVVQPRFVKFSARIDF